MTIVYRETDPVSGRWSGVGRKLTAFEVDFNFYQHATAIATLQSNESLTVSIAYITQDSPSTFTFHMTDHTLQGPFTIPIATFTDRGAWQANTAYNVNDTFTINGTLYLVIFPDPGQPTFSSGANDGGGHNYFSAMITLPGSSLPTGGAVGQVLTKSTTSDYAVTWTYPVPTGGTTGQFLKKNSSTNFDASWSANPLPAGGTTGQILSKINATDYNVEWSDSAGVSVEDLTDFTYTSPHSIGQVVQWDGAEWQNAFVAMSQLSDVVITSAANGDVLSWDGTEWVNSTLESLLSTVYQPLDAQLFSNIPQNSQSAAYTTVLTDGQKHIFHPAADTTARTFTIDSNANVAYPIGTAITFVNQHGAGIVTIAITSDTMRLAGAGTTGSRSLAADGLATALKIDTTEWIISGSGLT